MACIVFVNHGPRMATKVGLSLAMLDAAGTVLGVDVMYPTGKFFVDQRSAYSGGRVSQEVPNGNCHGIGASGGAHSTFSYRAHRGDAGTEVAAILVSVREIVYDDGTAWRSDQVPQTGDHLALPTAPPFAAAVTDGPPRVTPGMVATAPIEITDAYAYESVVQTGGGAPTFGGLLGVLAQIPQTTRSRAICMTFANRDARDVKNVRVNLAVVDRAGIVGAVETMDSKGPFATATASADSGSNCESIRGKWDADTFMYQPRGDGATPFAVGRVVVTPGVVEFVDGTSWTAPNPPAVGAPLALSTAAPIAPATSAPQVKNR